VDDIAQLDVAFGGSYRDFEQAGAAVGLQRHPHQGGDGGIIDQFTQGFREGGRCQGNGHFIDGIFSQAR